MKKASLAFAVLFFVWGGTAVASDSYTYQCRHASSPEIREIEVVYLQREAAVPCEVNYAKNGVEERLWSASYTEGYCEAYAKGFVEKQKGWGWHCQVVKGQEPDNIMTVEELEKTAQ